jgi:nitrate reductase NapE component
MVYIVTGIIWIFALLLSCGLLIIPGIYLANMAYLLAAPICIVERHYFFSGIGRMIRLAQNRWWKTFVINLVTFLIMVVPIIAAYGFLMWTMIQGSSVFDGTANTETMTKGGFSVLSLVALTVYAAVCALVYPLYSSVGIVHYNSLRSEKESTDIAAQLDSLTPAPK